jgi:thiol:disulfide interchange protein
MGFGFHEIDLNNILLWPFIAAFTGAAIILGILIIAFWVWMIVDCARRKFRNDSEKIIWIIVIVLAHWLGSLTYFIVIKLYNPRGLTKR